FFRLFCCSYILTVFPHSFIFFFQAEDGIRDRNVTGVQTCALPITLCTSAGDSGMDFSSPSSRSNSGDPKYFVLFHLNGHYPLGHCHHGQKVQLMYVFSKSKLLGYLNLVKTSVFLRVSSGLWHLCCH